jgi:hypothetical protein
MASFTVSTRLMPLFGDPAVDTEPFSIFNQPRVANGDAIRINPLDRNIWKRLDFCLFLDTGTSRKKQCSYAHD